MFQRYLLNHFFPKLSCISDATGSNYIKKNKKYQRITIGGCWVLTRISIRKLCIWYWFTRVSKEFRLKIYLTDVQYFSIEKSLFKFESYCTIDSICLISFSLCLKSKYFQAVSYHLPDQYLYCSLPPLRPFPFIIHDVFSITSITFPPCWKVWMYHF